MRKYDMDYVHVADLVFEQIVQGIYKVIKDNNGMYGVGTHVTSDHVILNLDSKNFTVLTYEDLTRPFYANFKLGDEKKTTTNEVMKWTLEEDNNA
jgi:hypothetical protein